MTWPTNPEGKPSASYGARKLGEVCEKINLIKAPIGSWPYVEIGDIDIENKSIIFKDKKSIRGAIIAPADSVLVSRVRPTRGAIVYIDKDYVVSSAFSILKPKLSESFSKFLFYWLGFSKNFFQYLQKKQKGSNYPSVRDKDILNFRIHIPPLKIQRKIVERLDAIKKAQELNDKQIELAEELFQSLLNKELNPKGKNWKIKKLKETAEIIMGQSPPSSTYNTKRKGLPFFQGKLEFKEIYPAPTRFCSQPIRIAKKNDVLLSVRAPVGPVNLAPSECCIGRGLSAIRGKTKELDQLFLFYFMKLNEKKMVFLGSGSTFNAIGKNQIANIKIPLPLLETQRKIVEKLSAAQDYKKKLLGQKQLLQELFESVLNKSFKE